MLCQKCDQSFCRKHTSNVCILRKCVGKSVCPIKGTVLLDKLKSFGSKFIICVLICVLIRSQIRFPKTTVFMMLYDTRRRNWIISCTFFRDVNIFHSTPVYLFLLLHANVIVKQYSLCIKLKLCFRLKLLDV